MLTDEIDDALATAIVFEVDFNRGSVDVRETARAARRAFLRTLAEAGLAIRPVEPTVGMVGAARTVFAGISPNDIAEIWRVMSAAARNPLAED
jgi:predicted amino acid dehydrogenase